MEETTLRDGYATLSAMAAKIRDLDERGEMSPRSAYAFIDVLEQMLQHMAHTEGEAPILDLRPATLSHLGLRNRTNGVKS